MAAALAASLPAPQATPAPAAPAPEAIPASMAKAVDIEAEIPITCVQIDGLVMSKIMKHSRDTPTSSAHGLLTGLDLDGILEVSNSFAIPHHTSNADDDDKVHKSVARYQSSMLRALKEVQGDDNVVGFYQTTTLGALFSQSLIDTQAIYQDRLRHGGVIVVHDVSQTARGNPSFRAFKLSASFMDAYRKANFSTTSLINHRLTFSAILEEIPVRVRTNALLSSFLGTLSTSSSSVGGLESASSPTPLDRSWRVLDVGQAGTTRHLEQLGDAIDNYRTEEGNVAYMTRQIGREKQKAETYVAKRREENAARAAQGLAPLPEEDVSRLFKIPQEPSRLESMLLLGRMDGLAASLEGSASTSLVKMYGAKAA